jgi:hypothetical protein
MIPFHSVDAYSLVTITGAYQELARFDNMIGANFHPTEDKWVTGWSVILMPQVFAGDSAPVGCNLILGQVAENGVPKFNFAADAMNGGLLNNKHGFDFQFPPGYGIFVPGSGNTSAPQRAVSVMGILPQVGRQFFPFVTLHFQLASEVSGWVEPKIKTIPQGASQEVPFLIVQEPWEAFPINIIGVDLALQTGQHASMHVCNSASPDILSNVGLDQRTLHYWLPPGVGVPLPAAGSPSPPHIDCHIGLLPGTPGSHFAWMVVYYVPA